MSEILSTSMVADYSIGVACIICINDGINLNDLKRSNHTELRLSPNRFNLTIRARSNIAQPGQSPYFYTLFWMNSEKILTMIKLSTYQIDRFCTLELVVES
jgi:hypothetical protein